LSEAKDLIAACDWQEILRCRLQVPTSQPPRGLARREDLRHQWHRSFVSL